jgi:hypothetical protein
VTVRGTEKQPMQCKRSNPIPDALANPCSSKPMQMRYKLTPAAQDEAPRSAQTISCQDPRIQPDWLIPAPFPSSQRRQS